MPHGTKRLSDLTLPAMNIRFLKTRPKLKTGAQMIANNMARVLYSLPKMLIQHNSCPPFLHLQCVSACNSGEGMEPLANCISLLAMLVNRSTGTANLFWRNIRIECDRITSKFMSFNFQGLLATVQTLFIYLLLRMADGETEHNNHDAALLATLTVVVGELRRREQCTSLAQESLDILCPGLSWGQWIYQESRRRVCILFRIINMLVCMEQTSACNTTGQPGLILAPLPARKQLWEAASEEQWLQELHRAPSVNGGFGLTESGDLIELGEYQMKSLSMPGSAEVCTSDKSKENWEEWCAGMDDFGALIMLAASLPL
ncbi:hypothetical protein M011DRAFT_94579 [Sporormia fimetaria CBS 119925]|uniref:Transcription factor domain-containing protein n=1 Tax=Sporormia fimetaria CBS 119925 TaxID=1340428 RepID=A0A6A6V5X3_9PLEO|nr:hypothetical protein M011DRAFT_94579 [Sporormia fimetaria CBS 119925]